MFAINTATRTFLMYPDTARERDGWLEAISSAIETVAERQGKTPNPAMSRSSSTTPKASRSRTNSAEQDAGLEASVAARALKEKVLALAFESMPVRQMIEHSSHHLEWLAGRPMVAQFRDMWLRKLPFSHRGRRDEDGGDEDVVEDEPKGEHREFLREFACVCARFI